MRIIITGTPGTGKTEIAKKLAKRTGYELVSIKDFVNEKKLFSKGTGKGAEKEVDIKKLSRALNICLKQFNDYIIEGHLACEFKIPADFIFVLRTSPSVLKKRMQKRKYRKQKIDDNLEAEMLDYCVQRVESVYRITPLELDTSKRTIIQNVSEIEMAIKQKKKKLDVVNYTGDLKEFLRLR